MHIFGIGVDIVAIDRIEGLLARHGERFARRILGAEEFAEFGASGQPAAFLAKRFAAKEAVSKAMGTGFRDGMRLAEIGVGHDGLGRPLVVLAGRAAEIAASLGITDWHISLADERDVAIAYVTAVVQD
ncbi:MAG TPA: holo-ACP synthase [Thioalkalivibrio sp.]|nr:holo-ACP synthase [Thioalkalivibrio sp.]